MKNPLTVVLPMLILTSACAPIGYRTVPMPSPYTSIDPYSYRYAGPAPAESPVGRWDNVMLLQVATPVQVLMMTGQQAGGEIVSADSATLVIRTASGDVDLAATEVMRVDRLPGSATRDYVARGARGAAAGAGVVAVLGLLVGHVPPARLFAAGAIAGVGQSLQNLPLERGAVTIYRAAFTGVARRPESARDDAR